MLFLYHDVKTDKNYLHPNFRMNLDIVLYFFIIIMSSRNTHMKSALPL